MSKIQGRLQKAIERSRGAQDPATSGSGKDSGQSEFSKTASAVATGIFNMLPFAIPSKEVMEESNIVAATDDRRAFTAYNVLRTRILQRMRSNNWHSILITSAGPGEGKSVTSANLAISIARDVNQSAILVDLDLMRSSVAKYLGIKIANLKAGVGDYLKGDAELEDIVYSAGDFERLAVAPNRGPIENSSDLIGSPRMKELAAGLHTHSGNRTIVLYDMPPALACDDVLAMCPNVDAVLLVVGRGTTERQALEKTVSMLSEYNILGVVLNKADEGSSDNAYDYYMKSS